MFDFRETLVTETVLTVFTYRRSTFNHCFRNCESRVQLCLQRTLCLSTHSLSDVLPISCLPCLSCPGYLPIPRHLICLP